MKIFLKIFLTIALSTILLLTFFVNFIIENQKEELTNRLKTKIAYLRQINQSTISQLLYDLNSDILNTNLNALYLDEEIVKIRLNDYSNTLNFEKGEIDLSKDFIEDKIELTIDESSFGNLTIWYTKDIIKSDIKKFKIYIQEISLILLLLMLGIVFFFINKITNSIKKLSNATKEISAGNLDYKIDIQTNDEIGILANQFDEMKNSLKDRITTIDEQLKFQRLLMESVNTPIFIKDTKGNYIDCNDSFASFYGKTKEEISKSNIKDLVEGEYLTTQINSEKELFKKGGSKIFEAKIPNSKKEIKDLLIYKNTYFDTNNKLKWIIGTYFDITEINKAKEKIEKFNEELQLKVYERTIELEESNEELQTTIHNLNLTKNKLIESEKMASLGSLVAGVAHEINTPVGICLTAVTHFVEVNNDLESDFKHSTLTEDSFKSFLQTSNELSKLITSNLHKTAHLIKSFKQVAVDQTNEEKRDFNLKEYVEETLFSLTNILKKKEIHIKIDMEENIVINSYPGAFSQILTNFVTNTISHGFSNQDKGNIIISAKRDEEKLIFRYKDDGSGISEENLLKIYEPFFTTKRNQGGTGLGLNIIYNIVTSNLNGTINCNSEINKGTEFIITINNI